MAWNAPRSWVIGEQVTAAQFNAQLRDNFLETMVAKAGAAGDLFQGTGPNALARIPLGAVGNVLKVLSATALGWGAAPSAGAGFPAGTIAFLAAAACPAGWTEATAVRGRMILGKPSGGTLAGTVGTPLTNLGARTITQVVTHNHAAGSMSTAGGGNHTHSYYASYEPWLQQQAQLWGAFAVGTGGLTSTAGAHPHTITAGISSDPFAPAGAAAVDVTMPYVQLLACRKT